jgi:phosphate transport system permease protein
MRDRWRRFLSHLIMIFCGLAVLAALVPLAFVLFYVVTQGITSLNVNFFRNMPAPVGESGGGMANAIVGSCIVVGLGALFAIPIGILSGVYASEYKGTRLASSVRFAADTLNGVPSIVIGVFVYAIAVLPFRQFSAMAGGLALGIMMIPLIMRTTEELLLLVPATLREGAFALGATRARAVFSVVLPAALPGILTGILLALARIAGETAPLLFTALNNQYFSTDVDADGSGLHLRKFSLRGLASTGLGGGAGARRDRADVLAAGPACDRTTGENAPRRIGIGLPGPETFQHRAKGRADTRTS